MELPARAHDLADLRRLISYLQQRRAELVSTAGDAFDRRTVDATILLNKLWSATLTLQRQGLQQA